MLRDLAESAILPVFHLKETIRQKAGSTIIKNAIAMRRGEQLVQGADFQIHVVRDDDAILNVIRREGVRKDTQYMIPVKPGESRRQCRKPAFAGNGYGAWAMRKGWKYHLLRE